MYADRHVRSSVDPRSLGIAVALNGAVVAALLLANPVFTIIKHDRPLTTYPVAIEPPPPPVPIEKRVDHPAPSRTLPTAPHPKVDTMLRQDPIATTETIPPLPPIDTGPAIAPEPKPLPALVTLPPGIDPAYRGELQPTYPDPELRAEREGVVTVRVLIGADGRVRQVEQVSATSDAFFRATQAQALRRWRFHPATRGGVPVEAWRTMTIRFVIPH